MKNNITVTYDKYYVDDTGKNIPEVFAGIKLKEISLKSFWEGTIDAFYRADSPFYFTCIHGDIRIIRANDTGNNNFKFNQYYISGLDGKIIRIPENTWFGLHNLSWGNGIIMYGPTVEHDGLEKMSSKIFNWHSKR